MFGFIDIYIDQFFKLDRTVAGRSSTTGTCLSNSRGNCRILRCRGPRCEGENIIARRLEWYEMHKSPSVARVSNSLRRIPAVSPPRAGGRREPADTLAPHRLPPRASRPSHPIASHLAPSVPPPRTASPPPGRRTPKNLLASPPRRTSGKTAAPPLFLEETASIGAGVKGIKKRAQNEKFYSIFFKKSREWKGQSPFPGAPLPYFRS